MSKLKHLNLQSMKRLSLLITAILSLLNSYDAFAGDPPKTRGSDQYTTAILGLPPMPSGNYWQTGGNTLSGTEWLGSQNAQPLIFKTNSIQQMAILANGNIQITSLNNGNSGIVTYSNNGTLQQLNFNGNNSTVLTGNGTFTSFASLNPWQVSGTKLYYSGGNVGIGTSNPTAPLQVNGNIISNGNIYANNLLAANNIAVGTFKIVNGTVDSVTSTASMLQLTAPTVSASNAFTAGTTVTAGANGPSIIRIDGNAGTITSPSGVVGFANNNITTTGTINAKDLSGYLSTDSVQIKQINPVDSLIKFGDPVAILHVSPVPALPAIWNYPNGTVIYGNQNNPTAVSLGIGGYNAQSALYISSSSTVNQITVANPVSHTTMFNVDNNGNAIIGGKVAIGNPSLALTTPGNYGLYVAGGLLTESVKIALHNDVVNWSDYVFANTYKLKSLAEVESYVKANKHLPDVPSANEVKKDGINVAEMDATLLKKIEELTLYVIQQDKRSQMQEEQIKNLKNELKKLQSK
jgi:hypothetical protein